MNTQLITNVIIVNEGKQQQGGILIKDGRIADILPSGMSETVPEGCTVTDGNGNYLIPGVIDDQVHFREPGMTYKADIYTESKAAVAGGVTSYMEMPNTVPQTVNQQLLSDKFETAARKSLANYSFYIGATNDNIDEVLKSDFSRTCGVKVFMGSSTGNMLVNDMNTLEMIFSKVPALIAVHCEDEEIIRKNTALYRAQYGEDVPISLHPVIRSEEACFRSSSLAVSLAKKHNSRLHVLHLSTAKEIQLFSNDLPLAGKRITGEVCVHHLWFSDSDYDRLGTLIKWNPAVKTAHDREKLFEALLDGTLDVVATDHAPHTLEEKRNTYFKAPSGGPLVQHSLVAMLEFFHQGRIGIEQVVEKMCHNPAILFRVQERGFIRKGYRADLVLVDTNKPWVVSSGNILYKCGWSPFEGQEFHSSVVRTWVNGHQVYNNGVFDETRQGEALRFEIIEK